MMTVGDEMTIGDPSHERLTFGVSAVCESALVGRDAGFAGCCFPTTALGSGVDARRDGDRTMSTSCVSNDGSGADGVSLRASSRR